MAAQTLLPGPRSPRASRSGRGAGRRLLLLALVACGSLLLDHAHTAAGAASANGDTNGDGTIDVSDAVALLAWLFGGGPEPSPLACRASVPDTGQGLCYDEEGTEITCDSETFPGQDASYAEACPAATRFADNGNGTVSDACTGLMWSRRAEAGRPWGEALRYGQSVILCQDGTWTTDPAEVASHGGVLYDDWRLPNVRELGALVDFGRSAPSIDPVINVQPSGTWSSTSADFFPDEAWCVNFFLGINEPVTKALPLQILVVRDEG